MASLKIKDIPQEGRTCGSESLTASAVRSTDSGGSKGSLKDKNKRSILRIGEWNVRSLNKVGRLEDLKREMSKLDLDLVGISEVKWREGKDFWSGQYRVICSGSESGYTGVGVIMKNDIGHMVKSYCQVSDRIVVVRLDTEPVGTTVISVYMPTSAHKDEEVEEVYDKIEEQLRMVNGDENLIILGDWNAVVGQGKEANIIGSFGLGKRNGRGERLVEFCTTNQLVIANTFFKNPIRRIYTWKQPGDINRYQIDYIMVKQRFRNQVKNCKTFPGADIDSDHNLVVMKCNLKLKTLAKKKQSNKLATERLKEENIRAEYQRMTNELVSNTRREVEEEWKDIKEGLQKAAKNVIGNYKRKSRKPWITEEILNIMEERSQLKNSKKEENQIKYKQLRNEINRKCKEAKEKWIRSQCEDIEQEIRKGKTAMAYKKVKHYFGHNKIPSKVLRDEHGIEITDIKEKVQRWKRYLENLYCSEGQWEKLEELETVDQDEKGDSILRQEFDHALHSLKKNKAPGMDEIPAELIQNAGEKVKDKLYKLICRIYEEGVIPEDFRNSVIITLPKRANAEICENYRTISLLVHASKILTRIIYNRLEKIVEETLAEDQFGFRRNRGTREAILLLRTVIGKRMRISKPTYIAFVDLEKAFDKVDWTIMFSILKRVGIKYKDRRVIYKMYENQKATIKIDNLEAKADIRKGVRQGCSLSPILFNLYIEYAMNQLKVETPEAGVKIHGERIPMLRFADDIAVLAESEKGLEKILTRMQEIMSQYKMKINTKKTKVMKCKVKETGRRMNVKLGANKLEECDEYCYLGSIVTNDNYSRRDIRSRIAQAKKAFADKKQLLTSAIHLDTRKRFLKAYIWSVALNGCETWTLREEDKKRVEAFEMWCYRRMMKISWEDRITNEKVLEHVNEKRSILKVIQRRRDKMIGHLLRHGGLALLILEGMAEGKKARGRPRYTYMQQICRDVNLNNYREVKELAQNRQNWRTAANQSSD